MQNALVPSQEPEMPAMVLGGRNTRGRAQTKKTKFVEHVTQEEETPEGDEIEIHQVRQVQEVVKKVAVVRKGRGRRSAAQRQQEEAAEEEAAVEEQQEQEQEQEQGPSRRVTRRMDSELRRAMEQELEPMGGKPANAHRAWKRVVVEGGTVPEPIALGEKGGEEEEEEQTPAGGSQAVSVRRSARLQPRFHAEAVEADVSPGEALEPQLPRGLLEEAMREIEQEGQEEAEEEASELARGQAGEQQVEDQEAHNERQEEQEQGEPEFSTPDDVAELAATPEDLLAPGGGADLASPEEQEEQEEAQEQEEEAAAPASLPSPSARRKRKAPGLDKPAAGTAPAGLAGASRGGRRGRLFAAKEADRSTQKEAPAPEAAPASAPAPEEEAEEDEAPLMGAEEGERSVEEAAVPEEQQEGPVEEEEEEEAAPSPAPATTRQESQKRSRTAKKMPAARAPPAKAGKKRSGGARRGIEESYKRYVHRVLQQVHPELNISSRAMGVMQSFMSDAFDRLALEASRLTRLSDRKTLSSREVQTAVKLVLPGELGRHAVTEGKKAVARYSGL